MEIQENAKISLNTIGLQGMLCICRRTLVLCGVQALACLPVFTNKGAFFCTRN